MQPSATIPGKFVWFEHVAPPAQSKRVQAFYAELLGWRVSAFPMGDAGSYDMIYVGDTMIGGFAAPRSEGTPAHWISCVSVQDVDAAIERLIAEGGKVIEPAVDLEQTGRLARVVDAQGAALCLFHKLGGDPPDADAKPGMFFWNELHAPDAPAAVRFYERVLGYSSETLEVGGGMQYHVLSSAGQGRGGVSAHLPAGAPAHWLPYVFVTDPDAMLARVQRLGGKVAVEAMDIPDTGRFGVVQDPAGASLAVMHPRPRSKPSA